MTGDWQKEAYSFQGTSREERVRRALLPENIRMDGRNLHQWLAFLARSARMIRYFDQNNEPAGDWAPFLEKDTSVFLALLLDNRPELWETEVREILKRFYATSEASEAANTKKACLDLIHKMLKMVQYLDGWYKGAESLSKWGKETPLTAVLKRAIQNDLSDKVNDFWAILLALQDELPSLQSEIADNFRDFSLRRRFTGAKAAPFKMESCFSSFHAVWQLNSPPAPYAFKDGPILDAAVGELRQIFQRLHFTMTFMAENGPAWFEESLAQRDDHDPFTALLLTFLQLFAHLRDQLNTYPQRHLHHYYVDLLRQQPKKHVPDRTTVCFKLADHVKSYRLEKGALLLADVNEAGLESHYATTQDLVATKAHIAALKTLYVSKADILKIGSSKPLTAAIYAAPVANSRDGQGASFVGSDRYWPALGEEQWDKAPGDRRMTDARIGFAIAAPILALREGSREIDLKFQFTPSSFSDLSNLLADIGRNTGRLADLLAVSLFADAFQIYASGVKGWFPIKFWRLNPLVSGENTLTLTLSLSEEDPAIVDNIAGTLDESYDTPWPVLKIVLNPEDNVYLYDFLHSLELETIRIETRVKGLKSVTLLNELGLIDASAPFSPFGPMPNRSAYLLVGCAELFRKRLSALSFHIEWNNLPDLEGGFAEYYREYDQKIDNGSFQVGLSALSGSVFRPLAAAQQSFHLFAAARPDSALAADTTLENIQLERLQIQPNYAQRDLPEYSNHTRSGYFKLQLVQPPFAFGHADYPRLFSKAMIAQTRTGGLLGRRGGREVPLPREPYVPVVNKLTMAYTAVATLNLRPLESGKNDEAAAEKIFCLHPFGHQEIFAKGKPVDTHLLPKIEADGYLHIGLEAAEPEQVLSLFFHIRERYLREAAQHIAHQQPVVQWSYLHRNRWELFPHEALLADTTDQFTTKGIVKMALPAEMDTTSTLMPPGLFWLRASVKGEMESIGEVLEVCVNAVEAVWVDNGDTTHFDAGHKLPAVRELVRPRPEIAALTQPIGFEGGSPDEGLAGFYVRVSERLRHKNRAITRWDIEHLVLEHFPFVRETKCVTCMEYPELPSGDLRVVVIPQMPEDELEPMVGYHQLVRIQDFLASKASPFANILVINPEYEKIKITCTIRLKEGTENEKGIYRQSLQRDLLYFICPWLRGGVVALGSELHKNEVLDFIKKQPYIRFVTRFSLVKIAETSEAHFELTDTAKRMSETVLKAGTPWSVFVPVAQHSIDFTSDENYVDPEPTAIEAMRLGTDFIILEAEEIPDDDDASKTPPDPPTTEAETSWFLVRK